MRDTPSYFILCGLQRPHPQRTGSGNVLSFRGSTDRTSAIESVRILTSSALWQPRVSYWVWDSLDEIRRPRLRPSGSAAIVWGTGGEDRSEEHTSELQSLMRISYPVFCLKHKKTHTHHQKH